MDILSPSTESKPDTPVAATWRKWLSRIEARKKAFENGWWKQAAVAEKMYDVKANQTFQDNPFNVLFANTEVLLPSLYSASPRPDVSMRNQMAQDPVAQATEAYLTATIDMNVPGKETFDDSMESNTLSALVPGAGFVRWRVYPGEICPIRTEYGSYKDLIWGKTPRWSRVPWISFVHTMVREDILKQFNIPKEKEAELRVETQEQADDTQSAKPGPNSFVVYELWIKSSKKVVFLCDGYKDLLLEEQDDPLQLAGFYPTPGPLTLVKKPGSIDPTPLYAYYQNQAEELNKVTVRLNKVLSAIRVRGAYNNLLGKDIQDILSDTEMENGLIPTQNAMDLQGRGFEGHIWFLPLEQLIAVAKELYSARVQIMSVIQQITGLSDIVRGSTVASETATAQDLKNKWGTIRLRRMQRIVQTYVRDLLRIAVDIGTAVLKEEEWAQMTQLPFPTTAQKAQAVQQLQVFMEQAQQQAQMVPPPQPGAPPPQPPQPDPKLVKIAQSPSWGEILKTLKDDAGRAYTIDIETASTIDTDATADREEVTEFMGAVAQLFAGLQPLVAMGPSGMEVAKELLIAVTSKFKFGRQVKESLEKLQAPPPGQDPEKQAKAQAVQQDMAFQKQKNDAQMAAMGQENAMKAQQLQQDAQLAAAKHALDMRKLQQEEEKLPMEREIMQLKLETARVQAQNARNPPAKSNSR